MKKLNLLSIAGIFLLLTSCGDPHRVNVTVPAYGPGGESGSDEVYAWIQACPGCECNREETIYGRTGTPDTEGGFTGSAVKTLTGVKYDVADVKITKASSGNILTWIEQIGNEGNTGHRINYKFLADDLDEVTRGANLIPYGYELEHTSYDIKDRPGRYTIAVMPLRNLEESRNELVLRILNGLEHVATDHYVIDTSRNFRYPSIAVCNSMIMIAYIDFDNNIRAILLDNTYNVLRTLDITPPLQEYSRIAIAADEFNNEFLITYANRSGNLYGQTLNNAGDILATFDISDSSTPHFWKGKPIYLVAQPNDTHTKYLLVYHNRKDNHVTDVGFPDLQLQTITLQRNTDGSISIGSPLLIEPILVDNSTESASVFASNSGFTILSGEVLVVNPDDAAAYYQTDTYNIYRRFIE